MKSPSTFREEFRETVEAEGLLPGCQRFILPMVGYFLLVVLLLGAIIQAAASGYARWQHPPPGEMVDLGGYELHLDCQGEGSPTIIFEAGLGDMGHTFSRLQEELAGEYRTCLYDRAGLGWSERSRVVRRVEVLSDELARLLERANVPGPYVMVGQGFGALIVRDYAGQHPTHMAGLVLLDPDHELQYAQPAPILLRGTVPLFRMTVAVGAMRLIRVISDPPPETGADRAARATMLRTKHLWSFASYLDAVFTGPGGRYGALPGDPPLKVLSPAPAPGDEEGLFWIQVQAELAGLSAFGQHITVEETGHYLHEDRPDAVLAAIRQVAATD